MSNYRNFEEVKLTKDFNEIVDIDNWTHFHWICEFNYSNLEVIKYCVEHGADFNIKNIYGNTPFHLLCSNSYSTKEVLEYCLENGADLTIENINGKPPFYYICRYNKSFIKYCKPYMDEYDYIKTLKENNLKWKEYV